jgi:hypothetical protein
LEETNKKLDHDLAALTRKAQVETVTATEIRKRYSNIGIALLKFVDTSQVLKNGKLL